MQLAHHGLLSMFPGMSPVRVDLQVRYRNLRMQQALAEGDADKGFPISAPPMKGPKSRQRAALACKVLCALLVSV